MLAIAGVFTAAIYEGSTSPLKFKPIRVEKTYVTAVEHEGYGTAAFGAFDSLCYGLCIVAVVAASSA